MGRESLQSRVKRYALTFQLLDLGIFSPPLLPQHLMEQAIHFLKILLKRQMAV